MYSKEELDYVKYFTGNKKENYLICHKCDNLEDKTKLKLIEVEKEDEDWYFDGISGRPEIMENINNDLYYQHKIIEIEILKNEEIKAVKDLKKENEFLFLTKSKKIIKVNFSNMNFEILNLNIYEKIDFEKYVEMEISEDNKLLAIFNFMGQYGMIYDLENLKELMILDRGNYHEDVTPYTIKFYNNLVITSRKWDMIDIINPYTKEILTKRDWKELTEEEKKENRKSGFCTEFRSSVYISPNGKWIVEDGWMWHPVGSLVRWDFEKWFENKWEADTGDSLKSLRMVLYSWGNSIKWIDNDRIIVWGYGNDDDYLIPAVLIYDINTGKEINWFSGPDNNFIFDEYLFTYKEIDKKKLDIKNYILNVWDVEKGEKIFKEKEIKPISYNEKSKEFLSIIENGVFKLSVLKR